MRPFASNALDTTSTELIATCAIRPIKSLATIVLDLPGMVLFAPTALALPIPLFATFALIIHS
jgi:hypothetical protein